MNLQQIQGSPQMEFLLIWLASLNLREDSGGSGAEYAAVGGPLVLSPHPMKGDGEISLLSNELSQFRP